MMYVLGVQPSCIFINMRWCRAWRWLVYMQRPLRIIEIIRNVFQSCWSHCIYLQTKAAVKCRQERWRQWEIAVERTESCKLHSKIEIREEEQPITKSFIDFNVMKHLWRKRTHKTHVHIAHNKKKHCTPIVWYSMCVHTECPWIR